MISDKDRSELISSRLKQFYIVILENSKKLSAYNVYEHPILNKYQTTEDQLIAISLERAELRKAVINEYIDLHGFISSNCTPKE